MLRLILILLLIVSGVCFAAYAFTRDAYLQHRRNAVYDGNPPEDPAGTSDGSDGAVPE